MRGAPAVVLLLFGVGGSVGVGVGACAPALRASSAPGPSELGPPSRAGEPSPSPIPIPAWPGVSAYGGTAISELAARQQPDPFRTRLSQVIERAARDAGRAEPVDDPRLQAVAGDLARGISGMETPSSGVVEFLLRHYGLVESEPHLTFVRTSPTVEGEAELLRQLPGQLGEPLKPKGPLQMGVGVHRTATQYVTVVAVQQRNVDMIPVRRRMEIGTSISLQGRLLGSYVSPAVVVTTPDGQTHEHSVAVDARKTQFRATVTCDRGAGRYQVEVIGTDAAGPAPVANFPVYCGTSPPTEAPRALVAGGHSPGPSIGSANAPQTVAQSEARLLELLNRDRRLAGLRPLDLDRGLSSVARAHSQDMRDRDFVAHVSPTTGDAIDRVRRAGIQPRLLAENLAFSASVEDAHAGLMNSPGHRANILKPEFTRVGIGVVFGKPVSRTIPLLVTQLFM